MILDKSFLWCHREAIMILTLNCLEDVHSRTKVVKLLIKNSDSWELSPKIFRTEGRFQGFNQNKNIFCELTSSAQSQLIYEQELVSAFDFISPPPPTQINFNWLNLSSLWSDLSMWGHFLILISLRNLNTCSQSELTATTACHS